MKLKSVYSLKDKYEDLENKIKFDIGDIIIKDNYLYLVSEIIVLQKFELGLEINYKICCSNDPNFKSVLYNFEYVNENFELYKSADYKLKLYKINGGFSDPNLLDIALGKYDYPEWFNKEFKKIK